MDAIILSPQEPFLFKGLDQSGNILRSLFKQNSLPVLMRREPERFAPAALRRGRLSAWAGFAVSLVMIAGAPWEVIAWTVLLALVPVPYYLALRRRTAAGDQP